MEPGVRMRAQRLPDAQASIVLATGALALFVPALVHADPPWGPVGIGDAAQIAAMIATPIALVCAAVEWIFGFRRRLPLWIGLAACVALVLSQLGESGYTHLLAFDRAIFSGALYNHDLVAVICCVLNIFTAPVWGSIACAALVRTPGRRLAAAWTLSVLDLVLLFALSGPQANAAGSAATIATGAAVCMTAWTIAHLLARASSARGQEKRPGEQEGPG